MHVAFAEEWGVLGLCYEVMVLPTSGAFCDTDDAVLGLYVAV